MGLRSTRRRCRFWQKKNHLFRWSSFWCWRLCKQAKLSLTHTLKSRRTQNESLFGAGLSPLDIIGPFFFESKQREAVTVNGDRYRAILNEFLFTKIEEKDIGNIWFQQNGDTCHTAEATFDVWRPAFEDLIISPRADVVWPPRSCDLTPLDYYLWGAVKDKCYAD